jgi:hypothetical protein
MKVGLCGCEGGICTLTQAPKLRGRGELAGVLNVLWRLWETSPGKCSPTIFSAYTPMKLEHG